MGLEAAGFHPVALVERNRHACDTLRSNRLGWRVLEMDALEFVADEHPETLDVDLLAAGLPRVKSPAAQRRAEDAEERKLFEATIWLATEVRPRAVLLENVPALVDDASFEELRAFARTELGHLGYVLREKVLNAKDFGLAQDRRMGLFVAIREEFSGGFHWPGPFPSPSPTVGAALWKSMAANGWREATRWAAYADRLAPAIVGGSDRRGGADLGPTGSKKAWARLGINGRSIGDSAPAADFGWDPAGDVARLPKLTVEQVAVLQGFPPHWRLRGGKTARYRQLGHATPPPVAQALGERIAAALRSPSPAPERPAGLGRLHSTP
ncbi:DNA cytosine methyltransferase [Streptomyces sp. MS19]|uniref:DNA cytosine methyltransferase n=1 Tax=Streptomyces sp. MS19 TaxID=3385972 RepID=UPI0039A354A2